jgi:hypothetical protein
LLRREAPSHSLPSDQNETTVLKFNACGDPIFVEQPGVLGTQALENSFRVDIPEKLGLETALLLLHHYVRSDKFALRSRGGDFGALLSLGSFFFRKSLPLRGGAGSRRRTLRS